MDPTHSDEIVLKILATALLLFILHWVTNKTGIGKKQVRILTKYAVWVLVIIVLLSVMTGHLQPPLR